MQKTESKNCCSGRNVSANLDFCRRRTLCRMPRKSSPWVPDIRQDAVIKTSNQGKSHLLVLGKKSQGLRVEILRSAKYYPSLDFLESSIIAARGMEAVFFRSSCPLRRAEIRVQGRCSCWGFGGKAPKVLCSKKHFFTVGGFSINIYIVRRFHRLYVSRLGAGILYLQGFADF